MDHDKQIVDMRFANHHEAGFLDGMRWIMNGDGEWIAEYGRRLFETDPVLPLILRRLLRVP